MELVLSQTKAKSIFHSTKNNEDKIKMKQMKHEWKNNRNKVEVKSFDSLSAIKSIFH